jgi:hypothetical protein
MDTIDNPNEMAKKPATSTPSVEENIIALLAELAKSVSSIASRIDTMEHRFEYLERDVLRALGIDVRAEEQSADVEPHIAPPAPSLALLCDGRILLSTRDLGGVDLSGKEMFTGIVLSEAEAADVFDYLAQAFEEAAAHGAGWLLRQSKKKEKGEKDESGE